MKLIRMGEVGQEKPGVLLEDGTRLDVSGLGSDYDEAFFAGDGITKLRNWMTAHGGSAPRVSSAGRGGAPGWPPRHAVCIRPDFLRPRRGARVQAAQERRHVLQAPTRVVG